MRVLSTKILIFAALAALMSCKSPGQRGGRPVVVATIPPLQSLVADIAGDSVEVRCLTGMSADPETFDPSIAVMCDLYSSQMMLSVGTLQFERQLTARLADEAPGIRVVAVADSVPRLYGTHVHDSGDGAGHHSHHGDADPHVWTSARSLSRMTRPVADALAQLDPANGAYYHRRADSISARLDSLDADIARRLAGYAGDTLLVWHPALSYYARDYSLHQLALGVEGKEGSVAAMRRTFDASGGPRVRALFYHSPSDRSRAEAVGADVGLHPTLMMPMDPDYYNQLITITDAIVTAQ